MVTRCHVMTSAPHSHYEIIQMTVSKHNELLSIQFLLQTFKEGCPDHCTTEQPPSGARQVSHTLLAKFGDRLLDHVDQETLRDLDKPTYREDLAQIYRDLAAKATFSNTPSIWQIDWEELKITRRRRNCQG